MIPRYGEWDRTYRGRGLQVVGVHSAEYDWEREPDGIARFAHKEGIAWPVVLDPDFAAWRRYDVSAWPTAIVIDRAGVVRAVFVGDDRAADIERAIRAAL